MKTKTMGRAENAALGRDAATIPGLRESFAIVLARFGFSFASKVEDRPSLINSDSVVQLHGSQPFGRPVPHFVWSARRGMFVRL